MCEIKFVTISITKPPDSSILLFNQPNNYYFNLLFCIYIIQSYITYPNQVISIKSHISPPIETFQRPLFYLKPRPLALRLLYIATFISRCRISWLCCRINLGIFLGYIKCTRTIRFAISSFTTITPESSS